MQEIRRYLSLDAAEGQGTNQEPAQEPTKETTSLADQILAQYAAKKAEEAEVATEPAAEVAEAAPIAAEEVAAVETETTEPAAATVAEPVAAAEVAHVTTESIIPSEEEEADKIAAVTAAEAEALAEAEVEQELDLTGKDKKALADLVEQYAAAEYTPKGHAAIRKIRDAFDALEDTERAAAQEKWLAENEGEAEGFEFRPDGTTIRFNNIMRQYNERRKAETVEAERRKEKNQARKLELLEQLRLMVESEDVAKNTDKFRKLEEEWKSIGPVPNTFAAEIRSNYQALRNMFYDRRSIYFELMDLDRKKNLEAKQGFIKRAQALLEEKSLNKAVDELNSLHEEWRNTGPVPRDVQDAVWAEFKAVSDEIYSRRREYVEKLKQEQAENLRRKLLLVERAQLLSNFKAERFEDWNEKSQQVVELEQEWKAIGPVSGEKATEVNRQFWGFVKQFFASKQAYFKALDKVKKDNLDAKTKLCEEAESLAESEDWEGVANAIKDLQSRWKEIGPVPTKLREPLYQRFKTACDKFFERRREQNNVTEREFEGNLEQKREVLKSLASQTADKNVSVDALMEALDQYQSIGFVPRKAMDGLAKDLVKTVDDYLTALKDTIGNAEYIKLRITVNGKLASGGRPSGPRGDRDGGDRGGDRGGFRRGGGRDDRRGPRQDENPNSLRGMERNLRNKISAVENQIHNYETNLGFFANSRNVDALRKDVENKIKNLTKELTELKEQHKLVQQGIAEEMKAGQQG